MTRPNAPDDAGAPPFAAAAAAGSATRPASAISRMPAISRVVSTFCVVAPWRTPAMFVAVRIVTIRPAQSGEPQAPSKSSSAA